TFTSTQQPNSLFPLLSLIPHPPRSTLFPYTTLFRSESVGQLTQLETLNVMANQLTTLPESLGKLTQLQRLDVSQNQLTTLRVSRSEEHTSELQSRGHLVCRLLLEKKKKTDNNILTNT